MPDGPKLLDPTKVRPYGDDLGDGAVQMSFTLPVPYSPESAEAARQLARKLGLRDPAVVHGEDLGGYSFFIVYGHTRESVDVTQIRVEKIETNAITREAADEKIRRVFGRKLVVVGACIGADAHTVGIDAIMNMKGYHGHYGLERYAMIDAWNLGAQVPPERLLDVIVEKKADAALVSQVVTQRGFHKQNLTRLVELLEAAGVRERVILICGGPRIDHKLARELGYDAGFGPGSYAEHVAGFIIEKLIERRRLAATT
jgi:beta-lysine 5,6-aminomutase beta subunit